MQSLPHKTLPSASHSSFIADEILAAIQRDPASSQFVTQRLEEIEADRRARELISEKEREKERKIQLKLQSKDREIQMQVGLLEAERRRLELLSEEELRRSRLPLNNSTINGGLSSNQLDSIVRIEVERAKLEERANCEKEMEAMRLQQRQRAIQLEESSDARVEDLVKRRLDIIIKEKEWEWKRLVEDDVKQTERERDDAMESKRRLERKLMTLTEENDVLRTSAQRQGHERAVVEAERDELRDKYVMLGDKVETLVTAKARESKNREDKLKEKVNVLKKQCQELDQTLRDRDAEWARRVDASSDIIKRLEESSSRWKLKADDVERKLLEAQSRAELSEASLSRAHDKYQDKTQLELEKMKTSAQAAWVERESVLRRQLEEDFARDRDSSNRALQEHEQRLRVLTNKLEICKEEAEEWKLKYNKTHHIVEELRARYSSNYILVSEHESIITEKFRGLEERYVSDAREVIERCEEEARDRERRAEERKERELNVEIDRLRRLSEERLMELQVEQKRKEAAEDDARVTVDRERQRAMECVRLEEIIKAHKVQMESLTANMSRLKDVAREEKQQRTSAVHSEEASRKHIADLEEKLEKEYRSKQKIIEQSDVATAALQHEVDDANSKLSKERNRCSLLERELESARKETREVEERLFREVEGVKAHYHDTYRRKEIELESEKNRVLMERGRYEEEETLRKQRDSELHNERERLRDTERILGEERRRVEELILALDEKDRRIREVENESNRLRDRLHDSESQQRVIESKVGEEKDAVREERSRTAEARDQAIIERKEKERVQLERDRLKSEVELERERVRGEAESRRKAEDERDRDGRRFQEELVRLTEKIDLLTLEKEDVLRRLENTKQLLDEEISRRKHIMTECGEYQSALVEAKGKEENYRRELQDCHRKHSLLENEHMKLNMKLEEYQKQTLKYTQDAASYDNTIFELKQELKRCETNLKDVEYRNRDLEDQVASVRQSLVTMTGFRDQERERADGENLRFEGEFNRAEIQRERADKLEREQVLLIDRWERERERRESVEVERDRELQQRVASDTLCLDIEREFWNFNKSSALELDAERRLVNEIKEEKDDCQKSLGRAHDYGRTLDDVVAKLKKELSDQRQHVLAISEEKQITEMALSESNDALGIVKNRCVALEASLSEFRTMVMEVSSTSNDLQQQVSSLDDHLKNERMIVSETTREIEILRRDLEEERLRYRKISDDKRCVEQDLSKSERRRKEEAALADEDVKRLWGEVELMFVKIEAERDTIRLKLLEAARRRSELTDAMCSTKLAIDSNVEILNSLQELKKTIAQSTEENISASKTIHHLWQSNQQRVLQIGRHLLSVTQELKQDQQILRSGVMRASELSSESSSRAQEWMRRAVSVGEADRLRLESERATLTERFENERVLREGDVSKLGRERREKEGEQRRREMAEDECLRLAAQVSSSNVELQETRNALEKCQRMLAEEKILKQSVVVKNEQMKTSLQAANDDIALLQSTVRDLMSQMEQLTSDVEYHMEIAKESRDIDKTMSELCAVVDTTASAFAIILKSIIDVLSLRGGSNLTDAIVRDLIPFIDDPLHQYIQKQPLQQYKRLLTAVSRSNELLRCFEAWSIEKRNVEDSLKGAKVRIERLESQILTLETERNVAATDVERMQQSLLRYGHEIEEERERARQRISDEMMRMQEETKVMIELARLEAIAPFKTENRQLRDDIEVLRHKSTVDVSNVTDKMTQKLKEAERDKELFIERANDDIEKIQQELRESRLEVHRLELQVKSAQHGLMEAKQALDKRRRDADGLQHVLDTSVSRFVGESRDDYGNNSKIVGRSRSLAASALEESKRLESETQALSRLVAMASGRPSK